MNNFRIAETDSFQKEINRPEFQKLYKKIKNYVYPQIKNNPYFGINIKKLKGEFSDFYRYRIGNYRLFYKINNEDVIIFIVTIKHRKESYR
ncbi:type II toxin-antitoxin system RelE/ParE family toxin [bacterium]|nr:type II toxin-antitoxin system RelE/ParE family toxin [bacterium]